MEAPCSQASLRWVRGKLRLWRDSAWSECQYLQPFSLSNSISPKKCHLLLERKAMTNLHNILKNRDITLSTKVRLVKAMVFPVVMYGCESWTVKKADCQRIDAFQLWCYTTINKSRHSHPPMSRRRSYRLPQQN